MQHFEKIVLASGNAGKIGEITDIFATLGVTIIAQSDLDIESPPETGQTFVENALLKARFAANKSGFPAMADDSGIVVDALGGKPGVRSARYAGENATDEQNLDLLLDEMVNVDDENRGGGFHCAAVLVCPERQIKPVIVEAVWRGRILRQRRGDGGFGYDPVFLDTASRKTGAQMSREEKNAVSHRGKAFRELRRQLQELIS
jgi:XTP/dITP diphosphohydrolase